MKLTVKGKLNRFYEQFSNDDRVLVAINADPDAIASAMAVKRLLWRKVQAITICHINTIDRPDNIAMVELLGLKLVHMDELNDARFTKTVLVDSQPCHNERFEHLPVDLVIDHHPDTNCNAAFQDIRPKYGATATILTAYLRAAKIKPSTKLATALILGIIGTSWQAIRATSAEQLARQRLVAEQLAREETDQARRPDAAAQG